MPNEKDILTNYQKLHDDLTRDFYNKKHGEGITSQEQAAFDNAHALLWQNCQQELIAIGAILDPTINADKVAYAAATANDKISIIAKKVGLI